VLRLINIRGFIKPHQISKKALRMVYCATLPLFSDFPVTIYYYYLLRDNNAIAPEIQVEENAAYGSSNNHETKRRFSADNLTVR
jgi:hypothetical protein